jgi:hypothetical protein
MFSRILLRKGSSGGTGFSRANLSIQSVVCSSGSSCGWDPQGAPGFQAQVSMIRILSALRDSLAEGTLRGHRVFKSKFH